jgi:hypothetical protein
MVCWQQARQWFISPGNFEETSSRKVKADRNLRFAEKGKTAGREHKVMITVAKLAGLARVRNIMGCAT